MVKILKNNHIKAFFYHYNINDETYWKCFFKLVLKIFSIICDKCDLYRIR